MSIIEFKVNGLFEDNKISNKIYEIINNKKIIEIGGPSLHNYWIPKFYDISSEIDILNYSDENNISLNFGCGLNNKTLNNKCNFIRTNNTEEYILQNLNKYDVLVTSHVLEHQANPLKQLLLWKKLLKPNGFMIHVLPEKEHTSDKLRKITNFDKILLKFKNNVQEDDISEIDELIDCTCHLHLYDKTIILTENEINYNRNLLQYYKNNKDIVAKSNPLHQHVYDFDLLDKISNFIEMKQILFFNIYIDNWVFWSNDNTRN